MTTAASSIADDASNGWAPIRQLLKAVLDRRLVVCYLALLLVAVAPGPAAGASDRFVGLSLAIGGAAAIKIDRRSRTGDMLAITAVAWFFGNFALSSWDVLADFGHRAVFVHRAVLAHAAICFSMWRPRRWTWPTIAVVYAIALVPDVMRSGAGATGWAGVVTLAVVVDVGQRRESPPLARWWALMTAGLLACGVGFELRGAAYLGMIVIVATVLVIGVAMLHWRRARLSEAIVELLHGPERAVRAGLMRALGDPMIEVAFVVDGQWLDELGSEVDEPRAGPGRHVSRVEVDGAPVAAVIHDASLADDPLLIGSLGEAARLAAENVRMRAEVQRATDEAIESRARVSSAAHDVRQQFVEAIKTGPEQRMRRVAENLRNIGEPGRSAFEQLDGVSAHVEELLMGLGPLGSGHGRLRPALEVLIARMPLQIEATLSADAAGVVAEALWFVGAEALANVVKHSGSDRARVTLEQTSGRLVLEVADRGRGIASSAGGTGLQGLHDRMAAIGGTLTVQSSSNGTRLVASVPLV